MYRSVSSDIKKVKLNSDHYKLHKNGNEKNDFGMDNTSDLLDNGFGLYSTFDLKKNIGPIKTEYFRISLTRKGTASFDIGLEKYQTHCNYILFGIPGQIFSIHDISNDFLAYYMLFSEQFISNIFLKLNKKQQFPFLSFSGIQCFEVNDEMILMETKAYLLHTTMTISEIAYKLEFAVPSHFNRFFKKNCSQTPLDFRKKS